MDNNRRDPIADPGDNESTIGGGGVYRGRWGDPGDPGFPRDPIGDPGDHESTRGGGGNGSLGGELFSFQKKRPKKRL